MTESHDLIQSLQDNNDRLRVFMVNLMCHIEDEAKDFQSAISHLEERDVTAARLAGRVEGTFLRLAGSIRRELYPEQRDDEIKTAPCHHGVLHPDPCGECAIESNHAHLEELVEYCSCDQGPCDGCIAGESCDCC